VLRTPHVPVYILYLSSLLCRLKGPWCHSWNETPGVCCLLMSCTLLCRLPWQFCLKMQTCVHTCYLSSNCWDFCQGQGGSPRSGVFFRAIVLQFSKDKVPHFAYRSEFSCFYHSPSPYPMQIWTNKCTVSRRKREGNGFTCFILYRQFLKSACWGTCLVQCQ